MKKVTWEQNKNAAAFEETKPKRLGNLHERMQYLKQVLHEHRKGKEIEFDNKFPRLAFAIFELSAEVSFFQPESPPVADRSKE